MKANDSRRRCGYIGRRGFETFEKSSFDEKRWGMDFDAIG